MRFELLEDFTDAFRQSHRKGECGNIIRWRDGEDDVIVEFDGYEAERADAAHFQEVYGEFPNIVPWLAEIPKAILRVEGEGSTK